MVRLIFSYLFSCYVSIPDLEPPTWISNGILDVSSWTKRLWLNLPETDLYTPHPNQTCCFFCIPFLGNWPHHLLSNASQMLGVTWTLLCLPLATTNNHLHLMASPFPLPLCHFVSYHLLPVHSSGLLAPYLGATFLLSLFLSFYWTKCILLDPSLHFFSSLFIYFERERASEQGNSRERGRERIPSRLRIASAEPDLGLKLRNCEVVTWAETKSLMLNRLSHPGTPCLILF